MKEEFFKKVTRLACISAAVAMMSVSTSVLADKEEFLSLYGVYSDGVKSGEAAESLGKQAVILAEHAKSVYGETHDNTINLTVSAANHYRDAGNQEKALALYDEALGLYKKSDKDESLAMANLLMEILSSPSISIGFKDKTRLSNDLYSLLKDFSKQESPTKNATLQNLLMFNLLLEKGLYTRSMRGLMSIGETLVESSAGLMADNTDQLVRAQFNYARLAEARKRKDNAIEYFTKVIDISQRDTEVTHPYSLAAHARLVSLYESEGESEEATKHCLAIGRMTPWENDVDPIPLYRVNPNYPPRYAKNGKEGYTIMKFDLSPFGFVENTRIIESNGKLFEKESLKALAKWRYAPKFVNGKAITAKDLEIKLEYTLGSGNKALSNS